MQISDLVHQYNNAVSNGEPMTGKMGVEKLVSALSGLSAGNIFEGTVNYIKGSTVRLGLSNGQQVMARLDGKINLAEGQSMFFQVKSNDGSCVQIRPFTVGGEGANLTLLDALKAAGLPTDPRNLSMVNQMMQEQMPIDKNSLNEMYHFIQNNPQADVSTIVQMAKLGMDITSENISQFENYMADRQAITSTMDAFIDELPNAMSNEQLSMFKLVSQGKAIINIITEGLSEKAGNPVKENITPDGAEYKNLSDLQNELLEEIGNKNSGNIKDSGINNLNDIKNVNLNDITEENISQNDAAVKPEFKLADTIGSIMSEGELEQLNDNMKTLFPDTKGNEISMYSEQDSVVTVLKDIKELLKNTTADKSTLIRLFSTAGFKKMIKNALEQQWTIEPDKFKGEYGKAKIQISELYDKIEKQLDKMQEVIKASGQPDANVNALAQNIRGNIEFMNQVNNLYTYMQIPLKMNGQNASGELYVYTNKKNMTDPDKELSAFLHLDLDNLGATDVSIKMLKKEVSTHFYLDDDESYALVEHYLPQLEKSLKKKGYNCRITVTNEAKHVNFVDNFLKKDLPPTGQVHRYSFDIRA